MAYNNLGVIEAKRSTQTLMKGDGTGAAGHWQRSRSFYLSALDIDGDNVMAYQNLQQSLGLTN
jgi:hypothetical protein